MTEKTNEGICECGHHTKDHSYSLAPKCNDLECDKCKCQNYRYKKIKMVKCPHCKEEIDYLNYKIVKEITGTFSVDDKGFEEYDEDYIENRYEEYLCPECKEEIKDINVYDFLKGDVKCQIKQ